ncbi:GNAT family N-acetyltransferase [Halomonas ramblicola]|uniref:GNAT family N-acetyltransferase n=1 Tax=Halomonas ramblicola TaxID=747349 RepID=UPI0025B42AED|nr:GNAT family N-acetyltransferase [Halomonas ramblicola]MDN3521310.1 GNAT family N-acetyltransferase [Halomonas ramblicola]
MTTSGLQLLRLTSADRALVETLEASAGWPLGGSPRRLAGTLDDPSTAVFGLMPGDALGLDALAAYAVVARLPFEAELQGLLVRQASRGHGLGRRLLAVVVDQARGWGSERLLLEVRAGNAAAIDLYRGSGFREDGRRTGYYPPPEPGADREDAILMSLPLRPLG